MEDQVKEELAIVRSELRCVGVDVPLKVIAEWSVEDRAKAEQWAIHKRWSKISRPPCPPDHKVPDKLVRPRILNRWVAN